MDCTNTQQQIISYINRSLDEDEMLNFLEHIEECEDCRNELEIYYMLYMGYNRLEDFDEHVSYDLKGQLEHELRLMKIYVKMNMAAALSKSITATAAIGVCIMIFAEFFL